MAGMAQQGQQRCLDTLSGKTPYALPSLFVALTTTTPNATTAGTELTTGQYGGYARQALTGASWGGANSSGASVYNALVDFQAASSSTGTSVLGMEIWDASSAGTRLWWEPLSSISVAAGTHITFASGVITATIPPISGGVGYALTYAQKMCDHMTGKTAFGAAPSLFLALCSAASTTTIGTEVVYTGYSAGGRPALGTGAISAATVSGGNVVVTTLSQINFAADTGGTQTAATFFAVCDSGTVGAGNLIAGGQITGGTGTLSSGTTPDFPTGSTILQLN